MSKQLKDVNIKNKKKKKISLPHLKRIADTVLSKYILKRDKDCIVCGTTENLQCGHLITRQRLSIRWNLANCHAQCRSCNLRHEFFPELYTLKFIEKFGLPQYKKLVEQSQDKLVVNRGSITIMLDMLNLLHDKFPS